MSRSPDRKKTLTELEGGPWSESGLDSHVVKTCHRLRAKPIGELSVEDLRIMIGQGVGLRFLVPLALEALEQNPLAEGDFYPGDLLHSVLRLEGEFWSREWEWRARIRGVLEQLREAPDELKDAVAFFREATT